MIAERIRRGELIVRRVRLDTETEELLLVHGDTKAGVSYASDEVLRVARTLRSRVP